MLRHRSGTEPGLPLSALWEEWCLDTIWARSPPLLVA
jgi:hypothetical protein